MKKGMVYLVGAGPGDPGLITRRGAELLSDCDAVVYDALVNQALLADVRTETRLYDVGKRGGGSGGARGDALQDRTNRLLVRLAREGKRVVRLKGGDPFLLARGGEEAEYLVRHKARFEVVPGVTSITAVPAYAGIPLTHRGYSSMVTMVTGRRGGETGGSPGVEWEKISQRGTLVILMGAHEIAAIAHRLTNLGWKGTTPVAVVQWGTTPRQRILRGFLNDFVKENPPQIVPPAVIVVGKVASLGRRLHWLRFKPLFGLSVVVTRAQDQAFSLCRDLREAGAEALEAPVIGTRRFEDPSLKEILGRLARLNGGGSAYDWLVFTSPNGVRYFKEALRGEGFSFPRIAPKVCAIGPVTAEAVKEAGIPLARIAPEFATSAIPKTLGNVKGRRILLARVRGAPQELNRALEKKGAHIETLSTYETVPTKTISTALRQRILSGVDWITFTSSSTVHSFMRMFTSKERKKIFNVARAASIGPVTSAALREYGLRPAAQAKRYTTEDLAEEIIKKA
jgi:uroporphyrinogen III methyltransferase/synthase